MTAAAVAAACTLYASSAFALGFQFKITNQTSQSDGDHAELVLQAEDFVKKGKVVIKSKTAKNRTVKLGKMNPGALKTIKLKAPKGSHVFSVSVEAVGVDDVEVTIPLDFKTTRVDPVKIEVDKDGVDTGAGVIPFLGTFGAFIKMSIDRVRAQSLLEVGAWGPIAGFVVTVPVLLAGMWLSEIRPLPEDPGEAIRLGDTLLLLLGEWLFFPDIPAVSYTHLRAHET